MSAMTSELIGGSIVFSTVCPGADQRKHQSSASLPFVRGIHRSPVDSPHKGPVTRQSYIWWRHHACLQMCGDEFRQYTSYWLNDKSFVILNVTDLRRVTSSEWWLISWSQSYTLLIPGIERQTFWLISKRTYTAGHGWGTFVWIFLCISHAKIYTHRFSN